MKVNSIWHLRDDQGSPHGWQIKLYTPEVEVSRDCFYLDLDFCLLFWNSGGTRCFGFRFGGFGVGVARW